MNLPTPLSAIFDAFFTANRTTAILKYLDATALLESLDLTALLEYFNYTKILIDFKGGFCGNLDSPPLSEDKKPKTAMVTLWLIIGQPVYVLLEWFGLVTCIIPYSSTVHRDHEG